MNPHPPLLGRGVASWGGGGVRSLSISLASTGEEWPWHLPASLVMLLPGEAGSEEHGLHPSLLGRGVPSRAVEERHPCRFISHPEGRREGGGRGIPLLFWGEEVYSTFALVHLVEG